LQPPASDKSSAAAGHNAAERRNPIERIFRKGEFKARYSGRFLYTPCPDARRADARALLHAVNHCADAPQVRVPPPPPRVVRVADYVSKVRRLAAHCTLHCHNDPCSSHLKMLRFESFILSDPATPNKARSLHSASHCNPPGLGVRSRQPLPLPSLWVP
jgi:hypothetical protein